MGLPVDSRVTGVAVRDQLGTALDAVLVGEAGAAHVDAASPDGQRLVEVRRPVVPETDLGRQRLETPLPDRLVAARSFREVGDAGDLEPDDERRVVRDALRVRLGEADTHVGRKREALHDVNPRIRGCPLPS